MRFSKIIVALVATVFLSGAAFAQPGQLESAPAANPEVEAKVQAVSATLRCVVCKNQSIGDSNAGLAKDMVAVVREQIQAGASEDETRAFMVDRYGEFVLMKPRYSWKNAGLWVGPAVMLVLGGGIALWFLGQRKKANIGAAPPLSDVERQELADRLQKSHENAG